MASTTTKSDQATATDNRWRVVAAASVGAVLGGLWGWLYLTSNGVQVRNRIEPVFDDVADALDKAQSFRAVSERVTALLVLLVAVVLVPQTAYADAFVGPGSVAVLVLRPVRAPSMSAPASVWQQPSSSTSTSDAPLDVSVAASDVLLSPPRAKSRSACRLGSAACLGLVISDRRSRLDSIASR
jgi:hypothetical protein